ncbi:MAG: UDP-N-acetylmuramoyl-tripeptide--D-alanyl-D-alanine ligase [Streptosporangiaceae bacterium]
MISLPLSEVAELAGGRLADVSDPSVRVFGPVVTDSRRVGPGGLFVALPGERADGHDYARGAVDAGAVAVLAARPVGVPAVVMGEGRDVLDGLAGLARGVVDRLPRTVVTAVTGSSGKTTTKDLLAQVLGRGGPTIAPEGSYNNEIGHPLTVLRADATTRHLVLEVSARGVGHIAHLCRIAPPTLGIVLNVGTAHMGEFGSRAMIAKAKGELVEALPPDGVAILNADDPFVREMAVRTAARTSTYGLAGEAAGEVDVRATDVELDAMTRPRFTLVTPEGARPVRLGLHGRHNVANALAAAAAARALGMTVGEVADALNDAVARSPWRMEVRGSPAGITVVNDAYNANPDSVRAALDALVSMARDGRTWAVLGEMAELGDEAAAEHAAVGREAVRRGVSRLVVVGEEAAAIAEGAREAGAGPERVARVPDAEAATAMVCAQVRAGDIVLVKGSRVVGLELVAAGLLGGAVHA